MQGITIGLLVSRALQLIFAVVLLAVSIRMVQQINHDRAICDIADVPDRLCNFGRLPSSSYFAAFTGAWGVLDALVGLPAEFITAIPWFVVMGLDGLAALFYLAAGINLAALRSNFHGCGDYCTKWTAVITFNFLGFIVTLIIVPLVFLSRRNR